MRLTKAVRQQILDQNEGFSTETYYRDNNSHVTRTYTVTGGQVEIRSRGKGAWGGSQYDNTRIADEDETHRFLYNFKDEMNLDGIE